MDAPRFTEHAVRREKNIEINQSGRKKGFLYKIITRLEVNSTEFVDTLSSHFDVVGGKREVRRRSRRDTVLACFYWVSPTFFAGVPRENRRNRHYFICAYN